MNTIVGHLLRIAVIPVFAIALLGEACQSQSSPTGVSTIAPPNGQYTHKGFGMEFPETVDAFARVGIDQYDTAGNDVSVGYNNDWDLVAATVYVYPAKDATPKGTQPSETHFNAVKADIEQVHQGAVPVIDDDEVTLADVVGRKATYRFTESFAGANRPLRSDVFLFGSEKWYISYRFTYPEASEERAVKDIGDFMDSLKWPSSAVSRDVP